MALSDIDTFVIIMLENRSFDHVCGYLRLPDAKPRLLVDGLRSNAAWLNGYANKDPRPGKPPIRPTRLSPAVQKMKDPPHSPKSIDHQINTSTDSGLHKHMGGFVEAYEQECRLSTNRSHVMGYYDETSLPIFDFFARNFVICDNWFSPLPSATQPNRLMAMAGESQISDNQPLANPLIPNHRLVYDWLDENSITWRSYQSHGFPFFTIMRGWFLRIINSLNNTRVDASPKEAPFRYYSAFNREWNSVSGPCVIFIEPNYTDDITNRVRWTSPNDDHPPTGVARAQEFLMNIYQTITSNPTRWAKTMMIVFYDEHGGFFDHVKPLDIATDAGPTRFLTTGPRVPAFVISPQVEEGRIFSSQLDHTSVLRLLAERFTPGRPYSDAVAKRQESFAPLRDVLVSEPLLTPRIPTIPLQARLRLHFMAALSQMQNMIQPEPPSNETAQAFHVVTHEVAHEYPELLDGPAGRDIKSYVARYPNSLPLEPIQ